MKLSEFENITRERLHHRTILPNEKTWDKLEKQLIAKKKNRRFRNISSLSAASIALMLSISLFFKNEPLSDSNNRNVEISKPVLKHEIKKEIILTESDTKRVLKTENLDKIEPKLNTNTVAVTETINLENEIEKSSENPESKKIIDQKVDEVVAKILDIQKEKNGSSDAEINALLAEALKEIKSEQLLTKAGKSIDANKLLTEVEENINNSSFKERVLLALQESYQTVKTAIVQSNN